MDPDSSLVISRGWGPLRGGLLVSSSSYFAPYTRLSAAQASLEEGSLLFLGWRSMSSSIAAAMKTYSSLSFGTYPISPVCFHLTMGQLKLFLLSLFGASWTKPKGKSSSVRPPVFSFHLCRQEEIRFSKVQS